MAILYSQVESFASPRKFSMFQKRVLQQVVGVVVVHHHASYLPIEWLAVGLDDLSECLPALFRVVKPFDYFSIVDEHNMFQRYAIFAEISKFRNKSDYKKL